MLKLAYMSYMLINSLAIGVYAGLGTVGLFTQLVPEFLGKTSELISVRAALACLLIMVICIIVMVRTGKEMDSLLGKIKKDVNV